MVKRYVPQNDDADEYTGRRHGEDADNWRLYDENNRKRRAEKEANRRTVSQAADDAGVPLTPAARRESN